MSLLAWRYRDSSGTPAGQTYYVEFDAVTVEEYVRAADVTQYPVETGGVLSDHYQALPHQITLYGVVSDTPVREMRNREGLTNLAPLPTVAGYPKTTQSAATARREGGLSIIRPVVSLPSARLVRGNIERARLEIPGLAKVRHFTEPVTRVADVFRVLDGLMETATPVSVVMFNDFEFTDMMITNMRAPRAAGSGGSIEFALDLLHIRSAGQTSTGVAPQRGDVRFSQKKDEGKKNPAPVEAGSLTASRALNTPWYEKVPDSTKSKSLLLGN